MLKSQSVGSGPGFLDTNRNINNIILWIGSVPGFWQLRRIHIDPLAHGGQPSERSKQQNLLDLRPRPPAPFTPLPASQKWYVVNANEVQAKQRRNSSKPPQSLQAETLQRKVRARSVRPI